MVSAKFFPHPAHVWEGDFSQRRACTVISTVVFSVLKGGFVSVS